MCYNTDSTQTINSVKSGRPASRKHSMKGEIAMRNKILEAVRAALSGSKKVKITFKPTAEQGEVAYLLGMERTGIIKLDGNNGQDRFILECVMSTGDWGHDNNRTIIVILTDQFDGDWFASRLDRALESIEGVQ